MHRLPTQSAIRRAPVHQPSFAGVRQFARKKASFQVVIQDQEGWEIPLTSVDISQGGVFVRSKMLFEVGEVFVLIFRLPKFNGDQIVRVQARVARVVLNEAEAHSSTGVPSVTGMAFEFLDEQYAFQPGFESLMPEV